MSFDAETLSELFRRGGKPRRSSANDRDGPIIDAQWEEVDKKKPS